MLPTPHELSECFRQAKHFEGGWRWDLQSFFSSGSRPDPIRDTKSPELNYRDPEFNYRVVSRMNTPSPTRSAFCEIFEYMYAEITAQLKPSGVTDPEIVGSSSTTDG